MRWPGFNIVVRLPTRTMVKVGTNSIQNYLSIWIIISQFKLSTIDQIIIEINLTDHIYFPLMFPNKIVLNKSIMKKVISNSFNILVFNVAIFFTWTSHVITTHAILLRTWKLDKVIHTSNKSRVYSPSAIQPIIHPFTL